MDDKAIDLKSYGNSMKSVLKLGLESHFHLETGLLRSKASEFRLAQGHAVKGENPILPLSRRKEEVLRGIYNIGYKST